MMGEPITPYKGRDANQIVSAALEMYEEGIEIEDAAKVLKIPARTIHRWLATNATQQWHDAQKARVSADYAQATVRRDEAAQALNKLKETLSEEEVKAPAERQWRLAHAREVLRAADTELDHQKWLLERLLSRLYGQKQEVTHTGVPVLNITVQSNPGRVIEVQDAELVADKQ
jgi:hypothetical protein